ncbi:hypothetical protein [Vibrio sp. SCSIO 43169]|uniref:hypothetical protein n=1 Tax=Vibrio sp. SCSIO 43169 TaxID=2822801 RepID=UPI002042CDBC|nr:hypothetical protein [Vibrio sp. SCSIO 43169]MCM5509787.1 hypothetical protein [Vibrio sp. SCSIO 43169]
MMVLLEKIRNLFEDFIEEISHLESKSLPYSLLVNNAKEVLARLNDPLAVWGNESDPVLVEKLVEFRRQVKEFNLQPAAGLALNPKAHELKYEIIDSIYKLEEMLSSAESNDSKLITDRSSKEISGLIHQLSVRQEELNESILGSLQNIDERTEAAERQVARVEKSAIQSIRKESNELIKLYSDGVTSQIEEGIKDIEESVNTAHIRLNLNLKEATRDLIKQHQGEYDRLYSELNSRAQDQIKSTDEARSEFDRKIDDLNKLFNTQVKSLNDRFDTERVIFQETLLQTIKEEVANYQSVKRLLKSQLDEAKDIVGVLSKKAMAHEHLEQARHEATAYWAFQGLGLMFLFLAIFMSVAIFGDSLGLKLPWLNWLVEFSSSSGAIQIESSVEKAASSIGTSEASWFFKRISIVLLLTAPGLYLLKEAANHRAKENLYRQRGVQLASITPYLKELKESDRNEIKKDLVKSFFSFHDGKADTQNVPDFLRDLKETTKIIRSIDRANQPTSTSRTFSRQKRRQPQATTKG